MYPTAQTCPTCGSKRIKVVRSAYIDRATGSPIAVRDLERQECPKCGEILFDPTALRMLREARESAPSRKASRKWRGHPRERDPKFIESIAKARADIAAGRSVSHEQLKAEFGLEDE